MKKSQLVNIIREEAKKIVKNELQRLVPELKKRIVQEVSQRSQQTAQNDVNDIMGSPQQNFAQQAEQRLNEYHGPNTGNNGNGRQQQMLNSNPNQQKSQSQQGVSPNNLNEQLVNKWQRLHQGMENAKDEVAPRLQQSANNVNWQPGIHDQMEGAKDSDYLHPHAKKVLQEEGQQRSNNKQMINESTENNNNETKRL